MGWVTVGVVVIVLFLVFLSLYFWASGPVVIADDERADIQSESPEEIKKEIVEGEQEDKEALKAEENEFYSHG